MALINRKMIRKKGKRAVKKEEPSPMARAVGLVGGKWKLLILSCLLEGPLRFTELKKRVGISQKVLTQTLRTLENDALITREAFGEVPPRVEYSLSPLGQSLHPVLFALQQWGVEHPAQR